VCAKGRPCIYSNPKQARVVSVGSLIAVQTPLFHTSILPMDTFLKCSRGIHTQKGKHRGNTMEMMAAADQSPLLIAYIVVPLCILCAGLTHALNQ